MNPETRQLFLTIADEVAGGVSGESSGRVPKEDLLQEAWVWALRRRTNLLAWNERPVVEQQRLIATSLRRHMRGVVKKARAADDGAPAEPTLPDATGRRTAISNITAQWMTKSEYEGDQSEAP